MIGIAAISAVFVELLARHVMIGGRLPFESTTIAILLGIALRAAGWVPMRCGPGLRQYEIALKFGIVLLGLGLSLVDTLRLGAHAALAILACVIVSPLFIYAVTRGAGLTRNLGILIGVGTTICGTAAIAVAAPVINARDEEVSYAVSMVSFFGAVAMVTLPMIGAAMAMTDTAFGIWAGLAVPSTPQVVGAGYIYSVGAGTQATVVKLTRNLFIIPAVFVLSLWCSRRSPPFTPARSGTSGYMSALPGFVFGFLALAAARSLVDAFALVPASAWSLTLNVAGIAAKALILVAMAGIGLNTRFRAMRSVGAVPLLVGTVATMFLAAFSFAIIRVFGVGL